MWSGEGYKTVKKNSGEIPAVAGKRERGREREREQLREPEWLRDAVH